MSDYSQEPASDLLELIDLLRVEAQANHGSLTLSAENTIKFLSLLERAADLLSQYDLLIEKFKENIKENPQEKIS